MAEINPSAAWEKNFYPFYMITAIDDFFFLAIIDNQMIVGYD